MRPDSVSYGWKGCNMNLRDKSFQQVLTESCKKVSDPWRFVNPDHPSVHVWRIHKFRPVAVPVEMVGQFFTTEVCVVLNVTLVQSGNSKPHAVRHVHVWVGKNAQESDYKAGFFWATQLDNKLLKSAVLHREIQGLESMQFRTYFCPIIYWRGQFEDSYWMKNVKDEFYGARLVKLYKPNMHEDFIVGKEVACSVTELDPASTFLLDTGRKLFIWHGNLTPTDEDLRCTRFVEKIRADRGCLDTVVEALDDDTETDAHEFFTYLSKRQGDGDDEIEGSTLHKQNTVSLKRAVQDKTYTLHKLAKDKRVSQFNMGFEKVKDGKQYQKEFEKYPICFYGNQQHVFVILNKKLTKEESDLALQYGHDFLKSTPSPFRQLTVVKYKQPIYDLKVHLKIPPSGK